MLEFYWMQIHKTDLLICFIKQLYNNFHLNFEWVQDEPVRWNSLTSLQLILWLRRIIPYEADCQLASVFNLAVRLYLIRYGNKWTTVLAERYKYKSFRISVVNLCHITGYKLMFMHAKCLYIYVNISSTYANQITYVCMSLYHSNLIYHIKFHY